MVELSSSTDPFQHGFPNAVFIIPAIVVVGLGVVARPKMGDVAEELFNAMGSDGAAGRAEGALPGAENPFNPDDFKMPTMEDFLKMLESMDNLSDEEKEELRAGVLQNAMRRKLQAGLTDYLVFFVMLAIMLAVFADPNLMDLLEKAAPEEKEKFLKSVDELQKMPALMEKLRVQALRQTMFYRQLFFFGAIFIVVSVFDNVLVTRVSMTNDYEENPFVEALQSDALSELLQDDEKRSLAQQFQDNLRTLSDMFVHLSEDEKRQFAKDFKGKFVKSLSQLNEFSKQKKIVQSTLGKDGDGPETVVDTLVQKLPGAGILWTDQFEPTPLGYGLLAGLLTLIVAFFGYKLYLSLTEKERKREEKLKAKQEKGKKKK
uniref:Transmembrane protein n=1 Tax=Anopheles culicifacies TaxID=139723 RepID=A0A182MX63_9DIPT